MLIDAIIRAWKDPDGRDRTDPTLPPHPAGLVELSDEELGWVSGGANPVTSGGLFCSFSAECMPTICNFNTWVCPQGSNHYEAVILLGGARAMDADNTITDQEAHTIQRTVEAWHHDPHVTGEQLENVNQIARDLRHYLTDSEWAELETGLLELNQTQQLTPEQLTHLSVFAESINPQ